jgi:hypothetical protein
MIPSHIESVSTWRIRPEIRAGLSETAATRTGYTGAQLRPVYMAIASPA